MCSEKTRKIVCGCTRKRKTEMKKILTLALVAAITSFGSFAGGLGTVRINAVVDETAYTVGLFHDDAAVTLDTHGVADVYEKDNKTGWNLSDASEQRYGNLSIRVSGNENSDKTFSVTVTPSPFKSDNINGFPLETIVTPRVMENDKVGTNTVTKTIYGLQKNVIVYAFDLKWNGNKDLPAGEYYSDVAVSYSVQ